MKTIFNISFFLLLMTSFQAFAQKKDYNFLTDSLNIEEKLKKYKLPGFSVVVFENYKIVYSKQFGQKSANSPQKIDENTAFSTASIAKPITALLCFILEEKGLINLNEPIDKSLKRWHLPKSKFTENNSPTWKQFLNHTAGTTQSGFEDHYEGEKIPTLEESLLGKIPRYDKEIEFTFEPGTDWQYSGGGYTIIQMALEDTFDKPIAELAKEYIFSPLGLKNTTMIQPNEKGFLTNVALVHDKDGKVIKTGLPITPQVGPSGLWSTPTDLAKIAIEVQNALRNKNNKVISHNVAKKMTEVSALKNAVSGWSYGWQKSFGYNNYDWFACNGSNTGVGGNVMGTMKDGNGFAFLANGEKPNRFPVMGATQKTILSVMNWNGNFHTEKTQEIPANLKKQLIGTYDDFLYGQGMETKIVEKNNRLYVESELLEHFKGKNDNELVYLKNGLFKITDYPNLLKFDFKDGKASFVTLKRDDLTAKVSMAAKAK
ncbi:beta-lactamase family protein [Chryseobacterium sp. Ch-15]|uniref:Beta-lactamase family protein n=1 Tax=Chryseobacterium muglaense TaxID=2893752 RepID=A0A9Q3UZS0_9FLAO|nr:serine hydrolase domain-containing protein [Chryseobacterium muglaense]MBD3906721.1 beta-lactamase family protein [Chryseobacterium muglaense]MCC9036615.1 beta-lactamase family protein [Chryseobacterium muglaense]MCM2556485.1 beta-lactamase family protein [Chryseobacterium muglaense]